MSPSPWSSVSLDMREAGTRALEITLAQRDTAADAKNLNTGAYEKTMKQAMYFYLPGSAIISKSEFLDPFNPNSLCESGK
jgi:hypothetical protein